MCIIVDTNVMSCVLDKNNQDYFPVFDWVVNKNGKFVYGGTKYLNELSKHKKFLSFLVELGKLNKTCVANKKIVDDLQVKIENSVTNSDFDDPHLIAIIIATKCKLISSDDSRADKFLKSNELFKKFNTKIPSIYRNQKHKGLLNDKNIAECCNPKLKLNNEGKNVLNQFLTD